jgi:predicted transcriptional regulator
MNCLAANLLFRTQHIQNCLFTREIIRYAIRLNRPIRLKDVIFIVGMKKDAARNILQGMAKKGLIAPLKQGKQRIYQYIITEKSRRYLI